MNDIIYLFLQLFRGKFATIAALVGMLILVFYFNMPGRQSSIECINGHCKIYNGEKLANDFAVKDINSCSASIFRIPCHNSLFGLDYTKKCYYPVIKLRNGQTIDLPRRFDSKYRSNINSFCNKIKYNSEFTYRK